MIPAIAFAILSPLIWGFMNVLDKFVISHKVKHPLSYAVVAGIVNIIFGLILALSLDWSAVALKDILFPALAGVLLGSQFFFYFIILKKEDVSYIIGFIYTYPVIVALLSFIFLGEALSPAGYLGVAITIIGVTMLSVRISRISIKVGIWMIIGMIFAVSAYEFFIKAATIGISPVHGIAVNSITLGLAISLALFSSKTRKHFIKELKNFKWALLNESFTFLAGFTTYMAMSKMPATVFSSISAIQPLAVLFLENIAHRLFGGMTQDKQILPKLIPITVIAAGVALIYMTELA